MRNFKIGFMEAAHNVVNDFRMTTRYKYLVLELDGDELISIDDTDDRKRVKFTYISEEDEIGNIKIINENTLITINFDGLFATINYTNAKGHNGKIVVPVTSLRLYLIDGKED